MKNQQSADATPKEKIEPLSILWEDDKVTKIEKDGVKVWKCGWCGIIFKNQHHTKALHRVAKLFGKEHHISLC